MLLMALVWMQNMQHYKRLAELITIFTKRLTMDNEPEHPPPVPTEVTPPMPEVAPPVPDGKT